MTGGPGGHREGASVASPERPRRGGGAHADDSKLAPDRRSPRSAAQDARAPPVRAASSLHARGAPPPRLGRSGAAALRGAAGARHHGSGAQAPRARGAQGPYPHGSGAQRITPGGAAGAPSPRLGRSALRASWRGRDPPTARALSAARFAVISPLIVQSETGTRLDSAG